MAERAAAKAARLEARQVREPTEMFLLHPKFKGLPVLRLCLCLRLRLFFPRLTRGQKEQKDKPAAAAAAADDAVVCTLGGGGFQP